MSKTAPDYREPSQPIAAMVETDEGDTTEEQAERRSIEVAPALHGQRLDKLLVLAVGEFSRSHLQGLIERGHVWVDGILALGASRKMRSGECVAVDLVPTAQSSAFRPETMALAVVFEDEHLLVVDKPAGLVVHPAAGHWCGTLLNGLLAHHPGAASLPRAGIVHRLDKDTSGLMVVGKSLEGMTALTRAIAAREVHREYQAIAHGAVASAAFDIEAPIGRDPVSRVRMAVVASGKVARTDVRRVAVGLVGERAYTAVRCILHTGRTHQIRVHMASRGHPLVADVLYGGKLALDLSRQALHAARLSFVHPLQGQRMDFEAPLPGDIAAAWSAVEGAAAS